MRSFGLTHRAETSLDAIAAYSRATFGQVRGLAYVDTLLERCRKLAMRHVQGKSCRSHFGDDLRDDLRFLSAASHFLIYVETPAGVTIIDIIHQSADIGGRLEGLEE